MKRYANQMTCHKLLTFVLLFLLIVPFGCSKKESERNEIDIGAVLPLTGEIAEYGQRCKAGMDLAIKQLNREGGINKQKLKILYEDTQGNPKEGVSAFQKLVVVDKVKFVIGAVASSVTLAIEPLATKNKVVLFSPASSSPKLTGISKYFFRNWPSDVFEATALADFVRSDLKLNNIAILYVNNDYGLGLKDEFFRHFIELGGIVPLVETYEQGSTDFRTQLGKIKASKPDGIYLAGYHREMAFATKQIRELGINAQILGDADYGVQELLEISGEAAEGAIYSIPEYDPSHGSEAVKAFADSFRTEYNREPSIFEANGYDAVMILADSISKVGLNTDEIAKYVPSIKNYLGASGEITFDIKGDVRKPVSIKMVKEGKFVLFNQGIK